MVSRVIFRSSGEFFKAFFVSRRGIGGAGYRPAHDDEVGAEPSRLRGIGDAGLIALFSVLKAYAGRYGEKIRPCIARASKGEQTTPSRPEARASSA